MRLGLVLTPEQPVHEDTVKVATLRLVMVDDALLTKRLPDRFRVVPVALPNCKDAIELDAFDVNPCGNDQDRAVVEAPRYLVVPMVLTVRSGFPVMSGDVPPTTVKPEQDTEPVQEADEVATVLMPSVADPYKRLPALNEVWPVPPCATVKALPKVSVDTLRLVMVDDAAYTDKLPVRFRVVPVATRFGMMTLPVLSIFMRSCNPPPPVLV